MTCNARWSTDFSDNYYRAEARCQLSVPHEMHYGPMLQLDGDDVTPLGVYASWRDDSVGAGRDTPER